MSEKKFRNHYSVVFENMVGLIVVLFFIAIQNIKSISDFLDSIDDLKASITDGSLGSLLSAMLGFVIILAIFAVIVIIQSVIWSKTWITITETAIIMEKNTIMRSKNTIGIKNISNVNTEQNLFEKVIGTCKVKLDTNSLSTANETDIKIVLRKKDAMAIRSLLLTYINQTQHPQSSATANVAKDHATAHSDIPVGEHTAEIFAQDSYDIVASAKDILIHGLCSINISTILVLIGCITGIGAAFGAFRDSFSGGTVAILSQLIMVLFIIGSCIKSLFGGFITYYDFKVARRGDKLHVHYGLLRTQDFTIPVSKISSVIIHQTLIARLAKRYMVEVVNVGMGDQENEAGSYIILACNKKQLAEHLQLLLPEFAETQMEKITRQPKAVWLNKLVNNLLWSIIVIIPTVAVCVMLPEIKAWMGILADIGLIGFGILLSFLDYITAGTYFDEHQLVTATGYFGRKVTVLPYGNIQYVKLNTNILLKHLGLTKGTVFLLASATNQIKQVPCCESIHAEVYIQKHFH